MDGQCQTVWILGSGFSRALGGPLLADLLSPPSNNFVQALYKDNVYLGPTQSDSVFTGDDFEKTRRAAKAVRQIFEQRGTYAERGRRFWDDAEAFLDQLDAAEWGRAKVEVYDDKPATTRMRRAIGEALPEQGAWALGLDRLRDAARRLVAAECCAFLKDANLDEERWQPYRSWVKELSPFDALVTFNYDRVLELLDLYVVDPAAPSEHAAKPNVFKLHGSVDWQVQPGPKNGPRQFIRTSKPENALEVIGPMIGIATPGPTKKLATEWLEKIWTPALERIKKAEVIVFVGYRFPLSDAEAREKLLGAVTGNTSPHVELHIVLGPDTHDKDVVRLEQLLRYAMGKRGRQDISKEQREGMMLLSAAPGAAPTYAVTTHALLAEDFFTVWHRNLLWPEGLHFSRSS